MNIIDIPDHQLTVIFAALCSMVLDVHSAQDNLSDAEWDEAERMWGEVEAEMNSRRQHIKYKEDEEQKLYDKMGDEEIRYMEEEE